MKYRPTFDAFVPSSSRFHILQGPTSCRISLSLIHFNTRGMVANVKPHRWMAVLLPIGRRLMIVLCLLCALWSVFSGPVAGETAPMGALVLHKSMINGRYFALPDDRLIYLQGSYEGSELQDFVFGGSGPSDFQRALDLLARHDGNILRLWTSESSSEVFGEGTVMQMPWTRSTICCAADGGQKFDLTLLDVGNLAQPSINSLHYFERMRARVIAARAAGVYVSIMLWHSFGWENGLRNVGSRSWSRHPFNIMNNINGVNADVDGDGHGLELGSIGQAFTSYQEAYVRQVVDTVGDLDNVLYEICNECYDTPATNAWQQYFRDFIRTYESGRGVRHPVGMTSLQNYNNAVLMESTADYISPGGPSFEGDPSAHGEVSVSIMDMDHVVPCPLQFGMPMNSPQWPWKAFTRGHNLWYIYCRGYGTPDPGEAVVMMRMAQTRSYANRLSLATTVPETDRSLCSTGYCLMGPEYVLGFLPEGGSIALTLRREGMWAVEWFDPASGNTTVASSVRPGEHVLTAPFSGEAVIFLVRNVAGSPRDGS